MKESEILRKVLNKLETLQMAKVIIWFSRLNSGKACVGKSWIQFCKAGTPDIISIIDCIDKIVVLFIECKRTGVKKIRFEQEQFFDQMKEEIGIYCTVINDPEQLYGIIRDIREHEITFN